jgi:hypothetical protein
MEKKLLRNETEYREWAWSIYSHWKNHKMDFYGSSAHHIAHVLGLCPVYECWDSIQNENGEWVDVDEDGNVIPEDTAEIVALAEWMSDVEYPTIAVYHLEKDSDRLGVFEGYICDFVSLNEFNTMEETK